MVEVLKDSEVSSFVALKGACINAWRFSLDSRYVLLGGNAQEVELWNPWSHKCLKTYSGGHNHLVNDITVTSDHSKFISVGSEHSACYWDVSTGQVISRVGSHKQAILSCASGADDNILLTGGQDSDVGIWDLRVRGLRNTHAVQHLLDAKDAITQIALTADSIITVGLDGFVRTYDMRAGLMIADFVHHPISSLSLSHDKETQCLVVACLDSKLFLIDRTLATSSPRVDLNEFQGHVNNINRLRCALNNSDSFVVCPSETGGIYIWDIASTKPDPVAVLQTGESSATGVYYPYSNIETRVQIERHIESDRERRESGLPVVGKSEVECNSNCLISTHQDGKIKFWNFQLPVS